ncbi:MAG TPA: hypothetical protein VI685_00840 [Candidatus Angelobacter sp.]
MNAKKETGYNWRPDFLVSGQPKSSFREAVAFHLTMPTFNPSLQRAMFAG